MNLPARPDPHAPAAAQPARASREGKGFKQLQPPNQLAEIPVEMMHTRIAL